LWEEGKRKLGSGRKWLYRRVRGPGLAVISRRRAFDAEGGGRMLKGAEKSGKADIAMLETNER
jgi:hypothetical protein